MRLFHFTSSYRVTAILIDGIKFGDVATSVRGGFNAPWLTADGDWSNQRWNVSKVVDRTEVRIEVELEKGDSDLLHWLTLCQSVPVSEIWQEAYHRGCDARPWYVYTGIIPPNKIVSVSCKPGVEQRAGLRMDLEGVDLTSLRNGKYVVDNKAGDEIGLSGFINRWGMAKTR